MSSPTWRVLIGDCRETLKTLPNGCVQACITSPPYYGLRSYLDDDHEHKSRELGLEQTPDAYVAELVAVFREVRRVLRDDGTLWLNLGDSYARAPEKGGSGTPNGRNTAEMGYGAAQASKAGSSDGLVGRGDRPGTRAIVEGLKPKDLVGIPWRVAFALQADGWYLRSEIIWAKPNPMPESVTDRPTKAHEQVFLLAKSERYYYDAEAIKEKGVLEAGSKRNFIDNPDRNEKSARRGVVVDGTRNRRSVWTIATQPCRFAHFATYPPKLVEPMVLASTSEKGCCPNCGTAWRRVVEKTDNIAMSANGSRFDQGKTGGRDGGKRTQSGERYTSRAIGWEPQCQCGGDPIPCTVLDPFGGSGTTAGVALAHGRSAILCELSQEYADMMPRRISEVRASVLGHQRHAAVKSGKGQLGLF